MVRPVLVWEGAVLVFYPGLGAEQAGPKTYGSYGSGSSSGRLSPSPHPSIPQLLRGSRKWETRGSGRSLTFNEAPYLDGAPCLGLRGSGSCVQSWAWSRAGRHGQPARTWSLKSKNRLFWLLLTNKRRFSCVCIFWYESGISLTQNADLNLNQTLDPHIFKTNKSKILRKKAVQVFKNNPFIFKLGLCFEPTQDIKRYRTEPQDLLYFFIVLPFGLSETKWENEC
jgi:hypothetical protein